MGKLSPLLTKIVTGLFIITIGVLGVVFSLKLYMSPGDRFMTSWAADFKSLAKNKYLHPGFENIKRVELIATSEKLEKIYRKNPITFNERDDGAFELQVFLDEIEGHEGVVIQYDLVDLATGNTVFELGRTFPHRL